MKALPNIDFEAYYRDTVASEEYRRISPILAYAQDVHRLFDEGETGLYLPWQAASGFRIRPRELTVWNGVNGHGKSLVLGQVVLGLAKQRQKACVLSMEMPPPKTIQRMARQAIGTDTPTTEYVNRFLVWGADKVWLTDFERTVTEWTVLGAMTWAHKEKGCTQFVVDSLMKCGIPEDDWTGQKRLVDTLTAFAKAHNSHVHLVTHSRKGDDEDKPTGKWDVKGTGTITDMADNVITVFRNKRKERAVAAGKTVLDQKPIEEKADALLRCDKQRHGEWEGVIPLDFHPKSMQYIPRKKGKPVDLLTSVLDAMDPVVMDNVTALR